MLSDRLLVLSAAFTFGKAKIPENSLIVECSVKRASRLESLARQRSLSKEAVLKINKPVTPAKTAKSRVSRALKARARLRQQHRMRSLFAVRNK